MMKGKLKKAVALVTALSCVQISPLAVTEVEARQKLRTCLEIQCSHREKIQKNL